MMDYPLKYAPIQQHGGAPLVFLDGIQLHVLQMDKIRSKAGGSLIFYAASSKFLFETFDRFKYFFEDKIYGFSRILFVYHLFNIWHLYIAQWNLKQQIC